jgi:tRNA(fMet)-specific endonuclease VapC
MKYLLDTNICIYLINGKFEYLIDRIQSHGIESIGISTITVAELEFGIAKSDIEFRDRNRDALFEFLLPFSILDFDTRAAFEYGNIRADLSNRGTAQERAPITARGSSGCYIDSGNPYIEFFMTADQLTNLGF